MNNEIERFSKITYDKSRPLIIVASSAAAARRARLSIDRRALRVGAVVTVSEGAKRLGEQAVTGAVWVELDQDDYALDPLLYYLRYESVERGYRAVISTKRDLLARVKSCLGDSNIKVLVDADEAERQSAIESATHRVRAKERLSDIANERKDNRLRELTKEVNLIATKLARLTSEEAVKPKVNPPDISPERVRAIIRARRARFRHFSEDLFADPAWDILLDLLHASLSHVRVPVSSLCIAAGVPATTALRWLKVMVADGLVVRRSDPNDARRIFVELTPETLMALQNYFAEVDDAKGA